MLFIVYNEKSFLHIVFSKGALPLINALFTWISAACDISCSSDELSPSSELLSSSSAAGPSNLYGWYRRISASRPFARRLGINWKCAAFGCCSLIGLGSADPYSEVLVGICCCWWWWCWWKCEELAAADCAHRVCWHLWNTLMGGIGKY